ncbi:MAG: RNA polymerase sigma factor [Candidatus Rokubacteria bacterium]|nr:RNA polymerase sigma factor [Candidatus Rokubacteria bacterium]
MGREPFEAVMAAHHAEIYRYLRRLTFRSAEAEDLSQETFLRAFRAYRALPPDANVRAWLFAIATNLFRNSLRAAKRRRAAYDGAKGRGREDDGDGPDGVARFNEARVAVEAVIDALPTKQRAAFVMRKVHELPYDEIAKSLHCSVDAARAHVFQAFRKIRHSLEDAQLPAAEGSA